MKVETQRVEATASAVLVTCSQVENLPSEHRLDYASSPLASQSSRTLTKWGIASRLLSVAELPWAMTVGVYLLWNEKEMPSFLDVLTALLPAISATIVGIVPAFHVRSSIQARTAAICGVVIGAASTVVALMG
jgi:hypothetical protein